jgi:DNA mismatch repair ATPase MutS
MVLEDLIPYWKDPVCDRAEPNTVELESMFLLTGPNGGGKSSILRSICAAALLSVCGFMVPARHAVVPRFDAVMLRMMATDSPADNKSSFQMVRSSF